MRRRIAAMFWMAVGAALAYYFDPERGRGRRTRLHDQIMSQLRDGIRDAERLARHGVDRTTGAIHEALIPDEPPRSDEELLQKVRSEAIGPGTGPDDHVEVAVSNGTVVLSGESIDPDRSRRLVERVAAVTGVQEVRNELVTAD